MFQRTNQTDNEQQILQYIRNAGYEQPTPLQEKVVPLSLQGRDLVVESGGGNGRTGAMLVHLLMQVGTDSSGVQAIILTGSVREVEKVDRQYRRFTGRNADRPNLGVLGLESSSKKELRILSGHPHMIVGTTERIIDHIRRENLGLDDVQIVVLVVPDNPVTLGFDKDVQFIFSKLSGKPQTMAFTSDLGYMDSLAPLLRRPQQLTEAEWAEPADETARPKETTTVSSSTKDEAADRIVSILETIKSEENAEILNSYKRRFKKHVPMHLRSYFTAYLLKEHLASEGGVTGDMKSLFVSVGRSRKVFPRDLVRLFAGTLEIGANLIGNAKVLDNYSFIDIPAEFAQRAIEKLNGSMFRGRKLTVDLARKKED